MQYMIVKEDDKFCVYEQGSDNQPDGAAIAKFDTAEEAKAKMQALIDAEEKSEGEPPLKPGEQDEDETGGQMPMVKPGNMSMKQGSMPPSQKMNAMNYKASNESDSGGTMPYLIKKEGDNYNVYKQGDNGDAEGNSLGKHPDEAGAKKQLAALYASVKDASAHESISPKVRTGYFAELASLEESSADAENKAVRVTLIKPGWSANNRHYSKAVLKEAAKLFEGAKAFANHPSKSETKDRPERSVREIAGWYEGVKVEKDGRLTALLNVIDPALWPIIEAAATRNPNLIGLSINALGQTRMGEAEGQKGVIVEAIVKANSTDIVTSPAAGGKFEALMASDTDSFTRDLLVAMPLDELQSTLREARPELIEAWQKEWKTPRDNAALDAAHADNTELAGKLDKLTEEFQAIKAELDEAKSEKAKIEKAALVDRVLVEAKLPEAWTEAVKAELAEAADEEAMKTIIMREQTKAEITKVPPKVMGAGVHVAAPGKPGKMSVTNPIAHVLKVNPRLMEANTPKEYARLKAQILTESKEK